MGIQSIAIPPLGCGQGGVNWKDVRLLIEKYLGEQLDLDVYLYEPAEASMKSKDGSRIKTGRSSSTDGVAASPA